MSAPRMLFMSTRVAYPNTCKSELWRSPWGGLDLAGQDWTQALAWALVLLRNMFVELNRLHMRTPGEFHSSQFDEILPIKTYQAPPSMPPSKLIHIRRPIQAVEFVGAPPTNLPTHITNQAATPPHKNIPIHR